MQSVYSTAPTDRARASVRNFKEYINKKTVLKKQAKIKRMKTSSNNGMMIKFIVYNFEKS